MENLLYLCSQIMDHKEGKHIPSWLKRTAYVLIAIFATVLLLTRPVFSFQEDTGIIYIRSFSMDAKTFYVTQTDIKSGVEEITDIMSVMGLHLCALMMLITCVACLLCFFSNKWRMILCIIAACLAGLYYLLMMYYAIEMTDKYYATLYPNLIAILPALVLQMMLLVRREIARKIRIENEEEEKEE